MYRHFEYCEALARRLKTIGHKDDEIHFLKSDEVEEVADLAERMSSISGMVLVAIDGHDSDFGWNNGDNLLEVPQYFITVMKNTPAGDTDRYYTTKEACKAVAFEIIKRMLLDRHEGVNGLEHLDPATITCRGAGPIGDNFYGVIIGFNLNEPKAFMLNPDMWL